jgi:two-component system KDP operon response regulator KdpE
VSGIGIKEKILLVEDEDRISSFITTILSFHEYEIIHSNSGQMAIHMAASHAPDAILLDLGLPDMDGIRVLERIREWSDVPVIVVSARQEENEKVKVLDCGANDYVTKPFGNDELLARIRTAIRIHRRSYSERKESVFVNGGLAIDYEKRNVAVDGVPIHLTPIEYKIIVLLSQNVGKVLTHDQILNYLWGSYAGESHVLRVNVANIRRKIEKNSADPEYILTEVGVGYRMTEIGV